MRKAVIYVLLISGGTYLYMVFIRVIEQASLQFNIPIDGFISLTLLSFFILFLTWLIRSGLEKITFFKNRLSITYSLSALSSLAIVFVILTFTLIRYSPQINGNVILEHERVRELLVVMNFMAIVVISYLGFKYLQHYNQSTHELEKTKRQQLEYQVKLYQQRLDPHFLFNNLNVLSAFIRPDNEEAQVYLKRFSRIYQHVVYTQNEDLIPLEEEINHVENYLFLMNKRFCEAYIFNFDIEHTEYLIIPNSIQLALENVIKHNIGDRTDPLVTDIWIEEDFLKIRNRKRLKEKNRSSRSTGLKNLNNLSEFILSRPLVIDDTEDQYTLSIPIIAQSS